jgi:hypothetical protein
MDIQVEGCAEPLHEDDGAALALPKARPPGALTIEGHDGPHGYRDDGAAQHVVPGKQIAHKVWKAEYPLADRNRRENVVHQVRGTFGHAASATAWAEAAPLAGERHEAVHPAAAAVEAREAAGQHAAVGNPPSAPAFQSTTYGALVP